MVRCRRRDRRLARRLRSRLYATTDMDPGHPRRVLLVASFSGQRLGRFGDKLRYAGAWLRGDRPRFRHLAGADSQSLACCPARSSRRRRKCWPRSSTTGRGFCSASTTRCACWSSASRSAPCWVSLPASPSAGRGWRITGAIRCCASSGRCRRRRGCRWRCLCSRPASVPACSWWHWPPACRWRC